MTQHIWSPWRMNYINNSDKQGDCIFCKALEQDDGPSNLILSRNPQTFIILNRFPYTTGHLMVVPYDHQPDLGRLDASIRSELMEGVNKATALLEKAYHPNGFNIGINLGAAAGAGVIDHVHIHVVPRWVGDANFMSTLASTRVLPETLEDTYQRLLTAWQELK